MMNSTGSAVVLAKDDVTRAIRRIAHEVLESLPSVDSTSIPPPLVVMGLQHGGVWLAEAIIDEMHKIDASVNAVIGSIDVSMYRDDIGIRPTVSGSVSEVPCDLDGALVVLVDDVLFTGRTVRAALDAIIEYGRPQAVRLAVMVDRGHRELPIRPDFVGKNLPTKTSDDVVVTPDGVEIISAGAQ